MIPYDGPIELIEADFHGNGIPTSSPGFYDHPSFLEIEARNPEFLNNYARFVQLRARDAEYEKRARKVVPIIARVYAQELASSGKLGACVVASSIVSRALEAENIWNVVIKGSLTLHFPTKSKVRPQYFYSVDPTREFVAGHAWVFAPPFMVVDVSIKYQAHSARRLGFIPSLVCARAGRLVTAGVGEILSPETRLALQMQGVPAHEMLKAVAPEAERFLHTFPATEHRVGEMLLRYIPVACGAPEEAFQDMRGLLLSGRSGYEIYREQIEPQLRNADA